MHNVNDNSPHLTHVGIICVDDNTSAAISPYYIPEILSHGSTERWLIGPLLAQREPIAALYLDTCISTVGNFALRP